MKTCVYLFIYLFFSFEDEQTNIPFCYFLKFSHSKIYKKRKQGRKKGKGKSIVAYYLYKCTSSPNNKMIKD